MKWWNEQFRFLPRFTSETIIDASIDFPIGRFGSGGFDATGRAGTQRCAGPRHGRRCCWCPARLPDRRYSLPGTRRVLDQPRERNTLTMKRLELMDDSTRMRRDHDCVPDPHRRDVLKNKFQDLRILDLVFLGQEASAATESELKLILKMEKMEDLIRKLGFLQLAGGKTLPFVIVALLGVVLVAWLAAALRVAQVGAQCPATDESIDEPSFPPDEGIAATRCFVGFTSLSISWSLC